MIIFKSCYTNVNDGKFNKGCGHVYYQIFIYIYTINLGLFQQLSKQNYIFIDSSKALKTSWQHWPEQDGRGNCQSKILFLDIQLKL